MVISYATPEQVAVKAKSETVTFGPGLKIGSFEITGAGEYDVAGIQCETHVLPAGLASFVRAEDLNLTFLTRADGEVTKLDNASNTDILVVELRSDDSPDQLKPILKSLEPAYLFLIGQAADPAIAQSLGLQLHDSSTLKITRAGLPLEGTWLVPAS